MINKNRDAGAVKAGNTALPWQLLLSVINYIHLFLDKPRKQLNICSTRHYYIAFEYLSKTNLTDIKVQTILTTSTILLLERVR